MSLYRSILQDLDKIETDIIPYWDSRLGGEYSLRQLDDFKDGNEFIDYWLQKVVCSNGSSCEEDECLWHTADYFYASSNPKYWENDWVKCVEGALESLESVQHVEEVTLSMPNKFKTIKQGLRLLLCFRTSLANWNLEKCEGHEPIIDDMPRRMKDYAQRAMRIFKLLPLTNVDGKSDISTLAEEITRYASYWREIRDSRPLYLTLEDPCGPEYETLVCLTDDLQYLLNTLLENLPFEMVSDIRCIVDEMDAIRCALSPTWMKIFVESGISKFIARDIHKSANMASHVISNLITNDSVLHNQQKIAHIKDVANNIYREYNKLTSLIDDFFRCARLILEEVVLSNTPATSYVRELSVLHTFIMDTENLLHVRIEHWDKQSKIVVIIYTAWRQLWSLCLSEPKSRKEFRTLSLDIFNNITANRLLQGDLLPDLIVYLVQLPRANELLHDLRGSLVTAEANNLFVKLVYSLEKTLTTEGVGDVVEDVEVEVLEAAHNYILFFREFKNDGRSGLKEGVLGFNASLRHAYDEYVNLPSMELSMSELEFFDMLLNLTECKVNDTSNSNQIGVLHDDLSTCFSFRQPYTMRHEKPEEVKQLWTQIMKLGRKVDNMIDTFEEFPTWYNKLRVFYVSEEVKLVKEDLSKISSRGISTTEGEGSAIYAENQMGKGHATEHFKDEVRFEEEDRLRVQLTTGSSLEKISIIGMPGLGKTTLAMSLYKDCAKSFHALAWCYVGQEFRRKELLQNIIGQISERPSSEINAMKDEDLAKLLKQCLLQKRNYLKGRLVGRNKERERE